MSAHSTDASFRFVRVVIAAVALSILAGCTTGSHPAAAAVGCTPPARAIPAQQAFVPNGQSGTVSVIDTATDTIATTIATIDTTIDTTSELVQVALPTDSPRAYILGGGFPGTISVIDTTTDALTTTFPLPADAGPPLSIAVSPDGSRAYIAVSTGSATDPGDTANSGILVLDTATGKVTADIALTDPGLAGSTLAISPDGTHLYAVSTDPTITQSVASVIDTGTDAITSTIPLPYGNPTLAISPDGTHLYATSTTGVEIIDASTGTVTATIPVPSGGADGGTPIGIAVSPATGCLYIADTSPTGPSASILTQIDPTTDTTTATIPLGHTLPPFAIALDPQGERAYIANGVNNTVSVIDIRTDTLLATIHGFDGPAGIALD